MHRNADVNRVFQGHAVVESDGTVPEDPAGLQEVDFEVGSIKVIVLTWM